MITAKKINIDRPIENFLPWTPTVDGKMIPMHIFDALKAGAFKSVPMIVGDVSEDAYLFVFQAFNYSLSTLDYEAIVTAIFLEDSLSVTDEYPPEPVLGDKRPQLAILGTDYIFECVTRYVFTQIFQQKNSNLYLYQFDHALPGGIWGQANPYCAGHVCHGIELPFVFYSELIAPLLNFTNDEVNLAQNLIGYWTNFARSSDPNMGLYTPVVNWPKWNPGDSKNIHFATPKPDIESHLRKDNCDYWDTIGYVHGW